MSSDDEVGAPCRAKPLCSDGVTALREEARRLRAGALLGAPACCSQHLALAPAARPPADGTRAARRLGACAQCSWAEQAPPPLPRLEWFAGGSADTPVRPLCAACRGDWRPQLGAQRHPRRPATLLSHAQVSLAGRVCRSWRLGALEVVLRDTAVSRPARGLGSAEGPFATSTLATQAAMRGGAASGGAGAVAAEDSDGEAISSKKAVGPQRRHRRPRTAAAARSPVAAAAAEVEGSPPGGTAEEAQFASVGWGGHVRALADGLVGGVAAMLHGGRR